VSKVAKIEADFKSVKISVKSAYKKVISKKVYKLCTFSPFCKVYKISQSSNFLCENFFATFSTDLKSPSNLCFRYTKDANMTLKIFFPQNFDLCVKIGKFEADFKSVEKRVKKFPTKNIISIKV
jgi:hypothetical protein